jgi:hypothetical protein
MNEPENPGRRGGFVRSDRSRARAGVPRPRLGLWDANVGRALALALTGQVSTQVLGPGAFLI